MIDMSEIRRTNNQHTQQECEGCFQLKPCRLFILQDGHAAFVCDDCRNGNNKK